MAVEDSVAISNLALKAQALFQERRRVHHLALSGHEPPVSEYPNPAIPVHAPNRPAKGCGVNGQAARYWLSHCAMLSGRMDDFDHETRRGYTIACGLLGLNWSNALHAIGASRTSGVEAAANVWAPYMSAPDARYVGHVYVARRRDGIGPVKVGFSTNVKKRMKRLSVQVGSPVEVICTHPGTMLIEWALHMDLGAPFEGKAEWYAAEQIPDWLCSGLIRKAA